MPPKNTVPNPDQPHRDAAANVVRDQLDALYGNQPAVTTPTPSVTPQQQQQAAQAYAAQQNHWQQYHTQWQDYYQKYYERYYVGHLSQAMNEQAKPALTPKEQKDEAILDLRQKILGNAKEKATKARRSRHFIPFASAIAVVIVVAFLQYNEVLFSNVQAYVSPGAIDPQNIVVDPTANVQVSADPKLIIPKINVDIGVNYDATTAYDSQMAAMKSSVAYFGIPGANSKPGQRGNVPLSGHSSNDFTDSGDAKFIFARLEQLQKGDIFYLNYGGTRYTYAIMRTTVVLPSEVNALQIGTDKPYATLITCTPLGTAQKRLLVFAEQISPSPSKAAEATTNGTSGASKTTQMAGKSPTLLERAFGAN